MDKDVKYVPIFSYELALFLTHEGWVVQSPLNLSISIIILFSELLLKSAYHQRSYSLNQNDKQRVANAFVRFMMR